MHPLLGTARGGSYTIGMSAMAMGRVALGSPQEVVASMTQQWAVGMCERLDIEVRRHGASLDVFQGPCLVMANHQSYLDILALYRVLPRPFGMVAKRELFFVPFFRGVMQSLGCVEIDRRNGVSAHRALQNAAANVRNGAPIVVFPEGTRSDGDRILPLKKGPFHLAQAAGVPIIPVGIRGSSKLMSRTGWGIQSGSIDVHIGTPIQVAGNPGATGRALIQRRVREALSELAGVPMRSDKAGAIEREPVVEREERAASTSATAN
jgi:1-acyl-sn-glycerol-3-phosphate acyltransferase